MKLDSVMSRTTLIFISITASIGTIVSVWIAYQQYELKKIELEENEVRLDIEFIATDYSQPPSLDSKHKSPYETVIQLKVSNKGGIVAKNLTFSGPYEGEAQISRRYEEPVTIMARKKLPLGNLRPGDQLKLKVWCTKKVTANDVFTISQDLGYLDIQVEGSQ